MKTASSNKELLNAAKTGENIQLEGLVKSKVESGIHIRKGDTEVFIEKGVAMKLLGIIGLLIVAIWGYTHIEVHPKTGTYIIKKGEPDV